LLATVLGDVHFKSEDLVAYEAGYRIQLGSAFSADFATFYNSYSNLLSAEPRPVFLEMSPAPVHLMMPWLRKTREAAQRTAWNCLRNGKAFRNGSLRVPNSFLSMDIHNDPNSLDTTSVNPAGSSPQHQYYLRSSLDLSKQFEQDITLRYVHSLDGLAIPSYHSLDARIGWKPTANVEFAVNGQNLTNNRHLEFRPDFISNVAHSGEAHVLRFPYVQVLVGDV
jgi:iron complex outermembrane receptor protein